MCVCAHYQVCVLTENTKWTINLRVAILNVYCNTTPVRASLRLNNTNGVQNLPLDFNGLTLHKITNIHNDGLSEKCQECQLQETTVPCFEAVSVNLPMFSYYWERAVATFDISRALLCTWYHMHFCSISVPFKPLWFKHPLSRWSSRSAGSG